MAKFEMEGVYVWHGRENRFTGKFTVDIQNSTLDGTIEDPNSECPMHTIEGRLVRNGKDIILEFTKSPPKALAQRFQPIEYQLAARKDSGPEQYTLDGDYTGAWRAAYPQHAGKIAIADVPNLGEAVVWMSEETENIARITLSQVPQGRAR